MPPAPADAELARLPRNDTGNGRRLVARHGREMAWVKGIGWLVWDGRRWAAESGDELALLKAQETVDAIALEADELPDDVPDGQDARKGTPRSKHRAFASSSGNAARTLGMLAMARPRLAQRHEDYDARPWHFNVANGTLRLDQGVRLYGHRPADRLTRLSPVAYDPAADCPQFRAFFETILPEQETALWVQKLFGYCLTNDIAEQCIAIFQGGGANGKSTLLEVIAKVLGDYTGNAPIASFLHQEIKKGSEASPDMVRLRGSRLIRTSEPEQGARLSESEIKRWTGGEDVTARELQQKFIDFKPSGKIIMSCNPLPKIAGKDKGTRRRIRLVKFRHTFADEVKGRKVSHAEIMFRAEAAGILNWMLDGFRMWWEDGLGLPRQIELDTDDYLSDQDPIGMAARDVLLTDARDGVEEDSKVPASAVGDAINVWFKRNALEPKSGTAIGRRLKEMGYRKKMLRGLTWYMGCQLNPDYVTVDEREAPAWGGR